MGSIIGQLIRTTAAERKVLLASGAGAGMAATFSTPLAGVMVAIELLLFEFKSRSFVPLVIATTIASATHVLVLGAGPLFEVAPTDFHVPGGLPWYILLGIVCGLLAVAFTRLLYLVEDLFDALPVDPVWLPAIGGLGARRHRSRWYRACWGSATTLSPRSSTTSLHSVCSSRSP